MKTSSTRSASSSLSSAEQGVPRAVPVWLFSVAACVALMVILGGLTRLTDSGLSITEWQPVSGILPPLTSADWQAAFTKYKAIPEYIFINKNFTMAEFKVIYWWEWSHRLLGRITGLVFFIPFMWFLWRRHIPPPMQPALWLLFALGTLQGFIGWYMVQSGLQDRVDVSPYRLAVHLGLALIIFQLAVWSGLRLWQAAPSVRPQAQTDKPVIVAGFLLFLTFIQALTGALVAGLDAGASYPGWPLMDSGLLVQGFAHLPPFLSVAFFENHLLVQLAHRIGAAILLLVVFCYWLALYRRRQKGYQSAGWLLLVLLVQAALGGAVLLLSLPLTISLLHQLGMIIILAIAVLHLHYMYSLRPALPV